ncbi:embryogenesis-associated protein EMB8-like [Olea europaea var. sylvestris]|uniref:embryogenesis-associated protein EMB8-like n=1 Tax=Olea europaea var. sylvestris TaxID=158386 RepID=UPI000C1CF3B2|nr:embryogenesis-associated protein EMB8-like [Olea europaea var. sylvestris]
MAIASLGFVSPLSFSLRHLKQSHCALPSKTSVHLTLRSSTTTRSASAATMANSSNDHHPSLEVIGGAMEILLPAFKTITLPYTPYPVFGWNRHVETIFAAFFRSLPDVRYRRECLRTQDNGAVALDWVSGDDRRLPSESPVLILLPGLTGGSGDTYVRHMLLRARNKGWRVVVFNSRGCGDSPVTTPQLYSASFLGDISEVVAHIGNRYPRANLYAAGWSLGANILVRYLGQESHSCPLSGAVSLCNPFNLVIADEDFRKGFNIVYDKALANSLCKIFKKHALLFEDIGGEFDIPMTANAKSVREFDEGLTRVSFGFTSVDDYYSNSSSSDSIKNVSIPLLCIQNQCFQNLTEPAGPTGKPLNRYKNRFSLCLETEFLKPRQKSTNYIVVELKNQCGIGEGFGLTRLDSYTHFFPILYMPQENPNCLLIVTPKGGHLGWVAGGEAPLGAPWTDPIIMDFLEHLEYARSSIVAYSANLDDFRSGTAQSLGLHQLEV